MNRSTRLLAIDDDLSSAELVARVASRKGYEAIVTTAPKDVSALVREWKPDVLSLDVCMPEIDAIELVAILSEVNFTGNIIMVSGQDAFVRDAASKLASDKGVSVVGSFRKPVDIHKLGELLSNIRVQQVPTQTS